MYGMVVGLTGPGQRFYVAVLEFPAPPPPDISLHRRIPDPERSVTVSASLLQTSTQGSPSVPHREWTLGTEGAQQWPWRQCKGRGSTPHIANGQDFDLRVL